MKHLLTIVIGLIILTGCGNREDYEAKRADHFKGSSIVSSIDYAISIENIDSCEYIVVYGMEGRCIVHKANCKNPIHPTIEEAKQ